MYREVAPGVTVVVPEGHGLEDVCLYPSVYVPGGLAVQGDNPFSEYSPGLHNSKKRHGQKVNLCSKTFFIVRILTK